MMDKVGDEGLLVDGRKLFFEYSFLTYGSITKVSQLEEPVDLSSGQTGHRGRVI
ncbi:hypothetical protein HanRHA438_Chr00c34g0855651 [Helianthus annuus]|nr:hypothetical protein HanIR_Chr05g0222751 [Helianthus annuus]KAJ0954012.1 hypothetical protein HanRHA438_Chr00c34g0855651 [Helianthus annuus]KAJ0955707.1 hypothetical protein HanPSC8_Chr01g0005971 [Helianthus annuus]